jgi:hypothetical protein
MWSLNGFIKSLSTLKGIDDDVCRAFFCTLAAPDAGFLVDMGNVVDHRNGLFGAKLGTNATANATGITHFPYDLTFLTG